MKLSRWRVVLALAAWPAPLAVAIANSRHGLSRANAHSSDGSESRGLDLGQLRACSDAELTSYALALAVGPSVASAARHAPPRCAPSQGQGLWPLGPGQPPSPFTATETGTARTPPVKFWAAGGAGHDALATPERSVTGAPSLSGNGGDQATHVAHLLVVQSFEYWCPKPCMQPTWELQSPKPARSSPYVLFEAAIWHQTRTVTLYQFDPLWERQARNSYHDVCMGKGWSCPEYQVFRESQSLLTVGPWPKDADEEEEGTRLSHFLLKAFKQIFARIHQAVPTVRDVGLSYTGHGAAADGALFEGALLAPDAISLMRYVTEGGDGSQALGLGQLAFLNFGGNCEEGKWNMLASLHRFAIWVVASDLEVGGLNISAASDEDRAEMASAMQKVSDLLVLKEAFETHSTPQEALLKVVSAKDHLWNQDLRLLIADQKLRQTVAVFNTSQFDSFRSKLREAYSRLSDEKRGAFQSHVEAASCDVLAAATFLDVDADSPTLKEAFLDLRPMFASTKSAFDWDVDANGLGFNFLSWSREPPCDLVSALGQDVPPPPGGWNKTVRPYPEVWPGGR
mmetsp:Transcript_49046/g.104824  ORF Transcript_49046/g.104824 Transcript_49046/m.104824 type:complete len:568 (-) Transcript_49046:79-1782(-)